MKTTKTTKTKKTRQAVDSVAKRKILKVVKTTNSQISTICSYEGLQGLTGTSADKAVEYRRGKPVNVLGHVLNAKNTVIDGIIINAANGVDVTNDWLVKQFSTPINNGKKFDSRALLSKWRAHKRHFAGKGKVKFTPAVTIKGSDIVKLMQQLDAQVTMLLK